MTKPLCCKIKGQRLELVLVCNNQQSVSDTQHYRSACPCCMSDQTGSDEGVAQVWDNSLHLDYQPKNTKMNLGVSILMVTESGCPRLNQISTGSFIHCYASGKVCPVVESLGNTIWRDDLTRLWFISLYSVRIPLLFLLKVAHVGFCQTFVVAGFTVCVLALRWLYRSDRQAAELWSGMSSLHYWQRLSL